jgi:uracil-DNA glycosylase family 4
VVVGQDFASQEQPHVRPDPTLRTNVNLLRLITSPRAAGIDPSRVYLTNAVLCLKPGPMSARVPAAWIDNCSTHLRRTIEIVNPVAVAALGSVAWRAVCRAFALPMVKFATSVGAAPLTPPAGAPALFAFAHCGALGTARRPIDRQEQDWARMGQWIAPRPRRAA